MTTIQRVIKYLAIAFGVILIAAIFSGILGLISIVGGISSWQNDRDVNAEALDSVDASFGPFEQDVLRLEMEIGAADIRITQGDTLTVQTDNLYITAEEKSGRLVIREDSHIADLDGSNLTLYIPDEMVFEDVYIATGAGRMQIDALNCRELDLELGAGMAEIWNLQVGKSADIDGGAGQIAIHSGSLNNLSFDMGVGEGDVVAVLTGDCSINAGIGALYLTIPGKLEDYTIHTEQGIGLIEVDNMTITGHGTIGSGPNRLEIEGGIGNITVDFEN